MPLHFQWNLKNNQKLFTFCIFSLVNLILVWNQRLCSLTCLALFADPIIWNINSSGNFKDRLYTCKLVVTTTQFLRRGSRTTTSNLNITVKYMNSTYGPERPRTNVLQPHTYHVIRQGFWLFLPIVPTQSFQAFESPTRFFVIADPPLRKEA